MAFREEIIDLVNRLLPVARRWAWPEWRFELRVFHVLPPDPPARHAPGLARQVIERQLEGLEPPAEALGIDQAIDRWRGNDGGLRQWPPGIIRVDMDARGILRVFYPALAQFREIFPHIIEPEGGEPAPAALADLVSFGHGP